jgi:recombination protein RecT
VEQYELVVADKKIKERFLEVTTEVDYNREINFAIQAIRGNDLLQKCDPQTIRSAVMNVALTGVTLNPALQQAFLIPRSKKCCLDVSFRGLCKIALDSGSVYDIDAVPVFEGDVFEYEMGLNPRLIHKPIMFSDQTAKKLIAVYAVAILHHGIKKFVVLDKEKIDRARKSAQTDNVWKAHEDEMAKKTAVKLLYKLLPQTERMSTAVQVLNEHEGASSLAKPETTASKVMERFGLEKEGVKTEQAGGKSEAATGDAMNMIACPEKMSMVLETECETCDKIATCKAKE